MICAVCKQEVPDIALHVFKCEGVKSAVKKSLEPKPMVVEAPKVAPAPQLTRQDINQMRREHPDYFKNWGGNLEPRNVPASPVHYDGPVRPGNDSGQHGPDAQAVPATKPGKESVQGAELEHALMLIKILFQYIHDHRNDPTQVVGENGRTFVYKMNYAATKYGLKTFVSKAQYHWLIGLEKSIHKAMTTEQAPSQ